MAAHCRAAHSMLSCSNVVVVAVPQVNTIRKRLRRPTSSGDYEMSGDTSRWIIRIRYTPHTGSVHFLLNTLLLQQNLWRRISKRLERWWEARHLHTSTKNFVSPESGVLVWPIKAYANEEEEEPAPIMLLNISASRYIRNGPRRGNELNKVQCTELREL